MKTPSEQLTAKLKGTPITLTNATLSYGLRIAEQGLEEACRREPGRLTEAADGRFFCILISIS